MLVREFEVRVPLAEAWGFLARVEDWPSWARHIRRIDLRPPGALTESSTGVVVLKNGIRSSFTMCELVPGRSWAWEGAFLWLRIRYDHRFEQLDARRTKIVFRIEGDGPGVGSLGRLFAAIYARDLDRAIPRLVEALE